jgi:hypothetical protein
MLPFVDSWFCYVYVESRTDWYFDSRLYVGSEIDAKIAHNIIRDQLVSRFVFYTVIARSLKRLDNLINLPLLTKTKVFIVVSSLVMSPSDSSVYSRLKV